MRLLALELKIAKCREKVIGVSAVLPVRIPSARSGQFPSQGCLHTPLLLSLPPDLVFITSKLEPGSGEGRRL